jgi:hypothetical protein
MNPKRTLIGIIMAALTLTIIPTIFSTNAFAQAAGDVASDKNPQKQNPITTTTVGPLVEQKNPKGMTTGFTQTTTTTSESCTTHGGQTPSGLAPEGGACKGNAENENAPQFDSTTTSSCQSFNKDKMPIGKPC